MTTFQRFVLGTFKRVTPYLEFDSDEVPELWRFAFVEKRRAKVFRDLRASTRTALPHSIDASDLEHLEPGW